MAPPRGPICYRRHGDAVEPCRWRRAVSPSCGIELDLSRYPLVIVRIGSSYSGADWEGMLSELLEIINRGPFGAIADTRNAQMPNAMQRRSFIDMYERNDRLTRAHFLVLGAVGDSVLLRGVITALNWLRPAPHPVEVFAKFDTAEAWVLSHLPESIRQQVPPAQPERR
jgi:hypothetical protein